MSKNKKSVLISGASTGIGKHCALFLAENGFRVFAGVRNSEAIEEIREVAADNLEPIILDVTDSGSISDAVERLEAENLYGIVNNAGVALLGPLEFLPVPKIRDQFEVNLFGHLAVTQAFLPLLRDTTGRIVNVSSISGRVAFPFGGAYAGSKFALEAFNDSLRRELAPWGIKVSLIEPGNIKTPIWEKSSRTAQTTASEYPPDAMQYYGERLMKGKRDESKMGEPIMVSKAVWHALTSSRPKTRYLVGKDALVYSTLSRLLPDKLLDRII